MSLTRPRVRVLLIEDSALFRAELIALLATEPRIEVVGTAVDPYVARDKILQLDPDVLLMDIGLPRMDGLAFLRLIMQHRPMPVIIISGLVAPGTGLHSDALEAGAFEVFHKPEGERTSAGLSDELTTKVLDAARFSRASREPERVAAHKLRPALPTRFTRAGQDVGRPVVLMGASTGGTEALRQVLTHLPADIPGICIVQHIPANFSRTFADRLNSVCAMEVREAADGDALHAGLALVAPGGHHLTLHWQDGEYLVRLNQGARVHHQRPSVDVLFDSAVASAGANAVAVLLTGMGCDGAASMKRLRDCGAATLAQDEASCVVFGMPQAAQRLGAAEKMVPLSEMHLAIQQSIECNAIAAG